MRRRDRLYAWLRTHSARVDGVLALLLVLALATPFLLAGERLQAALSVLMLAPLAWRRSRPVAATAVVFGAAFGQWLLLVTARSAAVLPATVGVLLALYAVAAYGPRWASRLGLGTGALVGSVLFGIAIGTAETSATGDGAGAGVGAALGSGGLAFAAWLLGDLRRMRQAYVVSLEERAARLELEREQEARLAAADERARIAREMHDVVAHSLSVVIAQADGGRYAAATSPDAAAGALDTIATTGRSALADMRRLLGVLRDDAAVPTAPQPGVDAVPELLDAVRASGLPVSLVQVGERRPLPPGLELAVFRIVQEGLTNVLKHAGPGTVTTVTLAWADDQVQVTVEDGGSLRRDASLPPDGTDGLGQGIRGMQERARLYGGSVRAAPRRLNGFRLDARLPYPGPA